MDTPRPAIKKDAIAEEVSVRWGLDVAELVKVYPNVVLFFVGLGEDE